MSYFSYFSYLSHVILIIIFVFIGCAEKEIDPKDPKKSFAIVKEPFDDGYYERAITKLGEFKSRFPYSQYTAEAELLIADAQFKLDKYPESAASYEQFIKLHPKHPRADYAQFQIGQSYWESAPDDIDREQDYTQKALTEWKKLLEKYPTSDLSAKAKELIAKGQRRLAEASEFIAEFYCKKEIYHACAYRFMKILDKFPEYPDIRKNALKKVVFALEKVAQKKDLDPSSDKNLFFKTMSAEQIREKAETFKKLQDT